MLTRLVACPTAGPASTRTNNAPLLTSVTGPHSLLDPMVLHPSGNSRSRRQDTTDAPSARAPQCRLSVLFLLRTTSPAQEWALQGGSRGSFDAVGEPPRIAPRPFRGRRTVGHSPLGRRPAPHRPRTKQGRLERH